MIIWFTGQPNSGKTTLAKALANDLSLRTISANLCENGCDCDKKPTLIPELSLVRHIDGDELRKLDNNIDYSINGRRLNVERAYNLAKEYETTSDFVIVSLVSPFRDQREKFKFESGIKEIYLISSRTREGKMVDYYEPPQDDCLTINTDFLAINFCVGLIKDYIKKIL